LWSDSLHIQLIKSNKKGRLKLSAACADTTVCLLTVQSKKTLVIKIFFKILTNPFWWVVKRPNFTQYSYTILLRYRHPVKIFLVFFLNFCSLSSLLLPILRYCSKTSLKNQISRIFSSIARANLG